MTTSRRFLQGVLLALLWAGSLEAQSGTLRDAWTSPCTLDVVLVTFRDTTGMHMGGRNAMGDTIWADAFNYDDHDLPHGYTIASDGALSPGTSSYTMDDFKRLLSGGYNYSVNGEPAELIPAYTGTPTVADNNDGVSETLPEVFGSLRHYFHAASGGDFELHVRILNLERDEYPVWVQLPQTKGYYAERFDPMMEEIFWLDAESTMRDSVRAWGLDPAAYNPPDDTYTTDRRLRHKVLYLHSGGCSFHFTQIFKKGGTPRPGTNVSLGVSTYAQTRRGVPDGRYEGFSRSHDEVGGKCPPVGASAAISGRRTGGLSREGERAARGVGRPRSSRFPTAGAGV